MINFSVIGVNALEKRIKSARQRLEKRKATNAKAVILIDRWIQKNFQNEGKEVGGWEPLAESTLAQRRTGKKGGKGNRILQDTGQLKSRWKHFWNNDSARVTSGVPYAVYHDSDKPRSKLPRRPILPDEKHILNDLLKLFGKFVTTSLRRADL